MHRARTQHTHGARAHREICNSTIILLHLICAPRNFTPTAKSSIGSDIKSVCREAAMIPMRRMVAGKTPTEIRELKASGSLQCAPITQDDLLAAIDSTSSSVSMADIVRHEEFARCVSCLHIDTHAYLPQCDMHNTREFQSA